MLKTDNAHATRVVGEPTDVAEGLAETLHAGFPVDLPQRQSRHEPGFGVLIRCRPQPIQRADNRRFRLAGDVAQAGHPGVVPEVVAHLDPVAGHVTRPSG